MTHDVFTECIIGFTTAAPIGPIAVLCIQRTLTGGIHCGIVSGLGSATTDALYSAIACSSIFILQQLLSDHQTEFQLLSGLLLCGVGYRIACNIPAVRSTFSSPQPLRKHYLSVFLLTLADPLPILWGMLLLANSATSLHPLLTSLGVFTGEMLWWIILSSVFHLLRSQFSLSRLKWLNRFSGGAIASFGCLLMSKAIGF
jgi:threonine/homoserine/homoserine lactone efflux protein